MTSDDLAARYGARRAGREWKMCCPAHPDRHPSLEFHDGDEGIVFQCRSRQCAFEAIVSGLGLEVADVMWESRSNGNGNRPLEHIPLERLFVYTDEQGDPLYRIVRKDLPTGKKDIKLETPDPKGGWKKGGIRGIRRVPYRLADLQGERILHIAEGEPKVDRLWQEGFPATCNVFGAGKGKWADPETTPVRAGGCDYAVLFPDNDPPGREHMEAVAKHLRAVDIDVLTLELPGLGPGEDVLDWFQAGHTADELRTLITQARQGAVVLASDVPTFEPLIAGSGYVYSLPSSGVRVELRYLRRDHGHLYAEVDVQCAWAGARRHRDHLSCADLNLSSQVARASLAKYCKDRGRAADFDWSGVLDAACISTIEAERTGNPLIKLDDAEEVHGREMTIYGLRIPLDVPSLFFAQAASLKSFILLLLLGTLVQQGKRALLLDWELTAERHKARKRRLFGDDRLEGLYYLRCDGPLVHEVDRIRRLCDTEGIELIGVDSVGLAADGKLNDDDVARGFYRALKYLPTAICTAHVPKGSIGEDKEEAGAPFGSIFFANLARATWLVKKVADTDDVVTVGLFPKKPIDGPPPKPVAIELAFDPDQIRVRNVEPADVTGFAEKMPIKVRMEGLLADGPMTIKEIADALKAKTDTIQTAVRREKQFVRIAVVGGDDQISFKR